MKLIIALVQKPYCSYVASYGVEDYTRDEMLLYKCCNWANHFVSFSDFSTERILVEFIEEAYVCVMYVCMPKYLCKHSYPMKDMCDRRINIYSLKNMCV